LLARDVVVALHQAGQEDVSATVLELEAKRLEVMKRRHQLQLSQMVSYEMERKQMQARSGMTSDVAIFS